MFGWLFKKDQQVIHSKDTQAQVTGRVTGSQPVVTVERATAILKKGDQDANQG